MPYAQISRAQLRARLQDRYTGDPFWTDQDANDALNESLRYFNLFTGFWWGTTTTMTQGGSPFCLLDAALTWRARVLPPSGPALAQKSILGLYRSRPNWRLQTITSGEGVPSRIEEWAPVGTRMIAIWPQSPGIQLRVEGVRATPVLLDDIQLLNLGEEQVGPILDESLWILTFKRPSLVEQMKPKHQNFLQACLQENDRLRRSAYFRKTLGLPQDTRLDRPARADARREA